MSRPKGSENKANARVKRTLAGIVSYFEPKVFDWINELDNPKDKIAAYQAICEYVIPKRARIESNVTGEQTLNVNVVTGVPNKD